MKVIMEEMIITHFEKEKFVRLYMNLKICEHFFLIKLTTNELWKYNEHFFPTFSLSFFLQENSLKKYLHGLIAQLLASWAGNNLAKCCKRTNVNKVGDNVKIQQKENG